MMEIIKSLRAMQQKAMGWKLSRKSVGLVPTMGALHEGHLSLIKRSKKQNKITVVSIFVNPTQFGPHEDYARYPQNLKKDLQLLRPLHVDVVFVPKAKEMFPLDFQTRVNVEKLSKPLCGQFRPTHFQGVATVVLKLFNLILPTRAYFGEKDYQQLQVVQQMVRDLNLPIEIVPCPLVRESDGLAMSSRNAYLSPLERKNATLLHQALCLGEKAVQQGEKDPQKIRKIVEEKIKISPAIIIDYIEVVHPKTLQTVDQIQGKVLLALAARIGKTRLIDNLSVGDTFRD